MIGEFFKVAERDERFSIKDLFDIEGTERSRRGTMKLHSELTWEPAADIIETEKEIIVMVDIAGMTGKDIEVVTDGKVLRIKGFRKNLCPSGAKQFHKLEIQVGPFERVIELPVPVDHSNVSARYEKGLLSIKILKLNPSERVRRVQID